jgi:cytochrome c oxidase assembly protein subunit 11
MVFLSTLLHRKPRITQPFTIVRRFASSSSSKNRRQLYEQDLKERNRRVLFYTTGLAVAFVGVTYASVPLYKIFCQMTGFGGTTQRADILVAEKMTPRDDARPIRVTFDGGCASTMPWSFRPQQRELILVPGETALAFYTAKNKTNKAITGVATYNVHPPQAGVYFNKIQCFCFEEQRLKAQEEIDMPVFFFIDPDICDDPFMRNINNITLSYTFFKTDDVNEEEVDDDE